MNEAKTICCKVFKIEKELYHVLKVFKDYDQEKQVFFSHDKAYDNLEHGMHLDKMIRKLGSHISNLASLRALIDIEFIQTKTFFKYTQLFYTVLCTTPFIAIQSLAKKQSEYLLPFMIWSQTG